MFISFIAGLAAMTRFSWTTRSRTQLTLNILDGLAVLFTLAINLTRRDAVICITAGLLNGALARIV